MNEKIILDACCGGKMFWFDKNEPHTLYIDNRVRQKGHDKSRKNHCILPDKLVDFTNMPFKDKTFKLVVFDPPHLFGKETGNMTRQYGWLDKDNWQNVITKGFLECLRVLDDYGTLIFKWNESNVSIKQILDLFPVEPLFGNKQGTKLKTHWLVFMKFPEGEINEKKENHTHECGPMNWTNDWNGCESVKLAFLEKQTSLRSEN